jgi:hypothetical protein
MRHKIDTLYWVLRVVKDMELTSEFVGVRNLQRRHLGLVRSRAASETTNTPP